MEIRIKPCGSALELLKMSFKSSVVELPEETRGAEDRQIQQAAVSHKSVDKQSYFIEVDEMKLQLTLVARNHDASGNVTLTAARCSLAVCELRDCFVSLRTSLPYFVNNYIIDSFHILFISSVCGLIE